LISVFLVGSVEVYADCTFYSCTGSYSCGEGILDQWTECVDIHIDADSHSRLYGDWFYCELGGKSLLSSSKSFTGICTSMYGSLGAAIDLRGRAMTVNFYELTSGCMDELRCTLGGCEMEL
jgi:hypothetical protein